MTGNIEQKATLIGLINYGDRGPKGPKGDPGSYEAMNWSNILNKPFESIGDGLKVEGTVLKVDTVDEAIADNTKPITSGAVQVIVGNIDTLLSAI